MSSGLLWHQLISNGCGALFFASKPSANRRADARRSLWKCCIVGVWVWDKERGVERAHRLRQLSKRWFYPTCTLSDTKACLHPSNHCFVPFQSATGSQNHCWAQKNKAATLWCDEHYMKMTHTFLMQRRIKEAVRAACLSEFLLFSACSCFSHAAALLHLLPHLILQASR